MQEKQEQTAPMESETVARKQGSPRKSGGLAGFVAWIVGGTAVGLVEMYVAEASPVVSFSGYSLLGFMPYYWAPSILGGILVWGGISAASRMGGKSLDGLAWASGLFAAAVILLYCGFWINPRLSGPPYAWPGIAANLVLVVVAVAFGILIGRAAGSVRRALSGRRALQAGLCILVAVPLTYIAWSWGNVKGGLGDRETRAVAGEGASERGQGAATDERARNVLLITIDALRADHLSLNGYERNTSPFLDRLAYEGANFSRAFSQATITVRSMASLFTSLYPQMHGLMNSGLRLSDSTLTLPEVLAEMGYSTAGFGGGNPSLFQAAGIVRGFDYYDDCRSIKSLLPQRVLSRLGLLSRISPGWEAACPPAETVFEKARSWLRVRPSEPYFLFIHLMDVHSPYLPPDPYASQFGDRTQGAPSDARLNARLNAIAHRESELFFKLVENGEFDRMSELILTPEDIGEKNLNRLVDLYDGEIAYVDSQLESFIEELRASGILERTLVVITADHGEGFLDHGRLFHSGDFVYDELMRVPLIMRCPGDIPPGTCIDSPVRLIDIMPTVLEIAGGLASPVCAKLELKGRSLVGLLSGDKEELAIRDRGEVYCEGALVSCVRTARWKYIDSKGHNTRELYDLMADPREIVNLFDQMEERALELAAVLEGYSEQVRLYQERHPGPTKIALDRETRERLRSLGYVE